MIKVVYLFIILIMNKEFSEAGINSGESDFNVVAEELARVLWKMPETKGLDPAPQQINIEDSWQQLQQLLKESWGIATNKTLALNLAGILSVELAKKWVGMIKWEVRYISPRSNLGSWPSVVSEKENIYHLPFLWEKGIPKVKGDLKKIIGLVAGYMEAGDKIYLDHERGKIVIFVEHEIEEGNGIIKIVKVWWDSDELEFPGSELVGVYKFSYPLSSGPLDPSQWDAFGII